MSDETKPSIEAIRARAAKATPGPWKHWFDDSDDAVKDDVRVCFTRDGKQCEWCIALASSEAEEPQEMVARWRADADFIAHAREDVPELLALVDAKDARLAELEAELAGIREPQSSALAFDDKLLCEILEPWAHEMVARYGHPVYLVGSAIGTQNFYALRDVDVVCILPDDEFANRFGANWTSIPGYGKPSARWAAEVGKISAQAAKQYTAINIDLKVQSEAWAEARHKGKPRMRIDGCDFGVVAHVVGLGESGKGGGDGS